MMQSGVRFSKATIPIFQEMTCMFSLFTLYVKVVKPCMLAI